MNNRRSNSPGGARRLRTESALTQHAQALGEGFGHLSANRLATVMGTTVMAIAIALPALMYAFVQNQRTLFADWGGESSLTLFLEQAVDESAAKQLLERLLADPRTVRIRFIHRDEAFKEFAASSGLVAYGDEADNPLPHVFILTPNAQEWALDRGAAFIESLTADPAIDSVLVDLAWVERLDAIGSLVERGVILLAMILAGGALLIVGNTTRALVHEQRNEIEVMKLVGATDAFVRRPFLYSGASYGLFAGVIAMALVQVIFWILDEPIAGVAQAYLSDFRLRGFTAAQAAALIGVSATLGWCGAWLATRLSLRQFDILAG